jgi:hypothetical protein
MAQLGQVPAAQGYPAGGSSAASRYTPVIYAKKLLVKFYLKTVFGEIANRDYEGEIKDIGDKVWIRTIPDVTVFDYYKGMDLTTKRQTPESNAVELDISKAKAYSIAIDDIDKLQYDLNMLDEWARDGSEHMGIAIDRSVLNDIYASGHSANQGVTAGRVSGSYNLGATGTPVVLTRNNILDYIVWCDSVLSENNVPINDRWMVIPEWAKSLINTSDLRSALFTGDSSNQNLRNGKIGQISNFTIYASNNLIGVSDTSGATAWNIIFGQKNALTFASQLVKNRVLELQNTFGTVMEGLQVYGYNVNKPEAMGLLYAVKGN